jgi:SAM-dependent methyltransferase
MAPSEMKIAHPNLTDTLLDAACRPYRDAGRFAYKFARGKLGRDPVFPAILELGLLQGRPRILDLGCGQGLLTAWLQAAARCCELGQWRSDWPAAPQPSSIRGIELMARDVERARSALGAGCGVEQGDIRSAEFGAVDAVVILDVLQYMDLDSQRQVLERARASLQSGGLLLLRVCDAGGGLRFNYTQWVDKAVMLARGHSLLTTHSRTIAQWREALQQCGFASQPKPMSKGTPFANVLLIAHAR